MQGLYIEILLVVMRFLEAGESSLDDTLPIGRKVYVIGFDNGTFELIYARYYCFVYNTIVISYVARKMC